MKKIVRIKFSLGAGLTWTEEPWLITAHYHSSKIVSALYGADINQCYRVHVEGYESIPELFSRQLHYYFRFIQNAVCTADFSFVDIASIGCFPRLLLVVV